MATQDVVIGAGAARSVQFNDANGTAVMVRLAGAGTASVSFSGDNFSQTANSRGVVLGGTAVTIDRITATRTNSLSSLQVATRGGTKTTNVGVITTDGALGSVKAAGVNLTGELTAAGSV